MLMECFPGKSYLEREIDATAEQKYYVISQVAGFMIELGKHPLSKAGSLAWRNEKPEISAIASNGFLVLDRYGPFDDALQYFKSIADQYLDLIADSRLFAAMCTKQAPRTFYLKHVDDTGGRLLVDENYNITGIIDWQFARFVPSCEAFGISLFTADLHGLYSELAGLSDLDKKLIDELRAKQRLDLPELAETGKLAKRFLFGLCHGLDKKLLL
ncbi:hypothetical protein CPC735_063820 [Coccidioides posadasii C735 delta SOWgp]|uniref:Aminoglycoside phosphotransferase domain-containing protein n=1 Tax=Coccidioides posadasii (strain C735) TaxID=222929 RepID=C5P491_COCP7|nr:hypothetical protein CPC735_063820 [Coccidioides posadasii C735 delta SOWgp]EER28509.1 hypothetical protein CPC735_063820 [Coccidioides posadasii C735 delta SOWgp]|eukprot:XP_003070654.1 hypothetical protein CPC735_063820 [Coccidioides posadasii C735 delta SOWgp]